MSIVSGWDNFDNNECGGNVNKDLIGFCSHSDLPSKWAIISCENVVHLIGTATQSKR